MKRGWMIAAVLIVLLACAAFLRLWNLGRQSFWVDEVNAVYAAESWIESGTFNMPSGYVYSRAPLYTYATALLFRVFGAGEVTTRFTAALFGILSIWMAYHLAKKIFNDKVGLLTAFLMTFSHFEVGWSRTARMYTMLQFFTLVFVYAFIKGWEAVQDRTVQPVEKVSLCTKIRMFLRRWGIAPQWLLAGTIVVVITYLYVHLLILFILGGLLLYCLTMTLTTFFNDRNSERIINKYSIAAFTGIAIVIISSLIPYTRGAAAYFLSYTPPWAEGLSAAQERMVLFEFLISGQRFPLAAFFFIGGMQILSRQQKLGWIPLWAFLFPLFILSFVFTHRVPTYLLYVYPYFLIVSAFGFINIIESEHSFLTKEVTLRKRWMKFGILALFFAVFVISPWFRITLHIPFFEDGQTNMAVTPAEWREAAQTLDEHRIEGDVVISSLPQVAMYYGVHSDYCLNWNSLDQSKSEDFKNAGGEWIDVYAGVVCVESPEDLERIVANYPRGWILISAYNLEHVNYTPVEVKNYIVETFPESMRTKNGSVLIYHWSHPGAEREL